MRRPAEPVPLLVGDEGADVARDAAPAEPAGGAVHGPVRAVRREGAARGRGRPVAAAEHVVALVLREGPQRREGGGAGRIRRAASADGRGEPKEKQRVNGLL